MLDTLEMTLSYTSRYASHGSAEQKLRNITRLPSQPRSTFAREKRLFAAHASIIEKAKTEQNHPAMPNPTPCRTVPDDTRY